MVHSATNGNGVAGAQAPLSLRWWLGIVVFLLCLSTYAMTLAPGTVYGDPSEYQFIPAIWGIAHPPGYAFYTLVAGVWQRLVAVGSVAYRTNLLAAVVGGWLASRVALTAYVVTRRLARSTAAARGAALLAALSGLAVGLIPDVWQHSVHANAHIMSAAITATQLWALVRWWAEGRDRWLFLLALLVGLGVTHHPITVWGIPAYVAFIIISRPGIVTAWRTIVLGVCCVALGMLPWLYFPLRSPQAPFGPTDMATWEGFLRHATAQGLRVNLFHFGLADQPDRLQVFSSLLRLQYGWLLLGLAFLGAVRLLVEAPRIGVLWLGYVVGHLAFTLNSVQDVMAYLLHPFAVLGLPLAVGALTIWEWSPWHGERRIVAILAVGMLGGLVVGRAAWHLPRISLRDWHHSDRFIQALHERFDGQGGGATFVSDWEHLTPYFYHTYVEGLSFRPEDLRYTYVTGATPWVESVFGGLARGPTYLSAYRRDVRELGFRLRPVMDGRLWQVLEPPARADPAPQFGIVDGTFGDRLQVVGYDLPRTTVEPGAVIPITLYARVSATQTDILMPMVELGEIEQRWTTDSRRLTPAWVPGEIIAEQYHLYVPFGLEPGGYPLTLAYRNMSRDGALLRLDTGAGGIVLDTMRVVPDDGRPRPGVVNRALTNAGNEVALTAARARAGTVLRTGLWDRPLAAKPGQALHLTLRWQVLAQPTTSYTVFIHLIDGNGQLWYGHDYTPLGGAFPSYLWFPKWLPGQSVVDPYRLVLPDQLPAGEYTLEVGLYEMGSIRRVAQLSSDGTMTGDRLILGPVAVSAGAKHRP